MPDSLLTDDSRQDRTARIEELLLSGLDYYFAGAHERAIQVWTRVLFLDRGHARARAYIERARSALAERQRESEELVQRGVAAFDVGETASARELLSAAIETGGPHDVALALLDRLNRLEPPSAAPGVPRAPGAASAARRRTRARASLRSWAALVLFIVVLAAAALYVAISLSEVGSLRQLGTPNAAASVGRRAQEPLPVPRSADLALWRAAALKNAGHLKDALAALDRIGPGDAGFSDADRLRVEIQGLLLAGLPPAAPRGEGR